MAKNRNSSKQPLASSVDVFEAIKRARIHLGFVRRKIKPDKIVSHADMHQRKLEDTTSQSHDILFKANTVFPFTLFPDTITLDREKLSIATRYFFGVAKLTSVPIRDILSVEIDIGPLFGSVHTSSRYFVTNPYSVRFLWREDAIKLHRMLQGYIIAQEKEIDCASIEKNKLIELLNDLGSGDTN